MDFTSKLTSSPSALLPLSETLAPESNMTLDLDLTTSADHVMSNSSAVTSEDCSVAFKFWFATVVIGLLCVLGLLGNALSIFVLQKDNHNRVACFLLQALACADITTLLITLVILSLLFGLLPYLGSQEEPVLSEEAMQELSSYIIKYVNPIGAITQFCTVWFTVLLAVNRYVAICQPFRAHAWCTLNRARLQVAVVIVTSLLFNVVRFFVYTINVTQNEDGATSYAIAPSSLAKNTAFIFVYAIFLSTLVIQVLPVVLLATLNTKLIVEVRRIKRRAFESQNLPRQQHEDNITLVMITIILLLLVCHTPDGIVQIIGQFLPQEARKCGSTYYYAHMVSTLLVVCNSSTNFIVYYLMRRGFRKVLVRRLCHCVKGTYSNTSAMFQTISYSAGKKKRMATSNSCPEFAFDNNSLQSQDAVVVLQSLDESRKVSVI